MKTDTKVVINIAGLFALTTAGVVVTSAISLCAFGNSGVCTAIQQRNTAAAEERAAELEGTQKQHRAAATEGFERAMIKRCENELKAGLKDPESYRRYHATYLPWGDEINVTIDYSAMNSFNLRIRDHKICRYVNA